jgi:DNA-binding transcriptional LysR family regulator
MTRRPRYVRPAAAANAASLWADRGSAYHPCVVPAQRLEYLIAVAREGSFTAAAGALRIAQPALSRQVRMLESQLGVMLLERTPQGVRPTAAGAALIERAGGLLEQLEQALDEATAIGQGRLGTLRVGYTASSSNETAPRLVAALKSELGDVVVRTVVLPRAELLAGIRSGSVDLGIVRCPPRMPEVAVHRLRDEPQGVLARADHPVLAVPELTLADAARYPILLHPREANPEHYDTVLGWCRAEGITPVLRERVVAFDGSYAELLGSEVVAFVGAIDAGLPAGLRWRALQPALTLPIALLSRPDDGPLTARAAAAAQRAAARFDWLSA